MKPKKQHFMLVGVVKEVMLVVRGGSRGATATGRGIGVAVGRGGNRGGSVGVGKGVNKGVGRKTTLEGVNRVFNK